MRVPLDGEPFAWIWRGGRWGGGGGGGDGGGREEIQANCSPFRRIRTLLYLTIGPCFHRGHIVDGIKWHEVCFIPQVVVRSGTMRL